jgi:hypothetical protein
MENTQIPIATKAEESNVPGAGIGMTIQLPRSVLFDAEGVCGAIRLYLDYDGTSPRCELTQEVLDKANNVVEALAKRMND